MAGAIRKTGTSTAPHAKPYIESPQSCLREWASSHIPQNALRLTRKAPRSRLQPETTSPGALSALKRLLDRALPADEHGERPDDLTQPLRIAPCPREPTINQVERILCDRVPIRGRRRPCA